jgi:protein O-mannosyl-transferase
MEGSVEPRKPIIAGDVGANARVPIWALAMLLAVATLGVYGATLRNGFVDFDDRDYVTGNEHVRTGLSWRNVEWALRSTEAANWHPVTWISHMADCQAFGLNPAGHHAVSVLLHAINAVLLFLLLNKGTGFRWCSFLVAALFALHPLNVETVAWISERKSLLSMLFSLLAVGCYGWYVRAAETDRATRAKRYLAVAFFFALALLSKPMAVTLPVVLMMIDYWPLDRMPVPFSDDDRGQFWKRLGALIMEKLPLFAMSAASAWVTFIAQRLGRAMSSATVLPIRMRLENAIVSYAKYIGKMFWPSGLAYYYPHPGDRLPTWQIPAAGLLLIGMTALLWRFRKRRHLVFGWKFFVVTLLPVIGIVQVGLQAMADRYAYLPLIGLFIIVVWELGEAAERWRVPMFALAAAATIVGIALSVVTVIQVGYWRDSVTLCAHARQVIPFANSRIETNLAAALLDAGKPAEAMEHFGIAESLAPDAFTPHFNIGYALAQTGENAKAVPELQDALRCASNPEEKARALNSLAVAELDLGKNEEAARTFSDLLAIQPNSIAGFAGRGQAFFNASRFAEASADFAAAIELKPAAELFLMAGKSLEAAGKLPEAAEAYRRALNTNSQLAEARERLHELEKRANDSATAK